MRKKDLNSDDSLMEGFRAGQQKCFAEIFNLLYASLMHYSTKFTKDSSASEDIVEDSFIKIWEKRTIFFELKIMKSYFYTTVRNASLDWVKNKNRFSFLSEISIDEFSYAESHINQYAVEASTYGILAKAIEQLPSQGKKIIKMIFFEGKKIRAISKELGISQSTVKTHKERAIGSLQKQFARK